MLLISVLIVFILSNDGVLKKCRVSAANTGAVVLHDHPRILENCMVQFEGTEGTPIEGFRLQKAFIMTNSGLQTPHSLDGWPSLLDPSNHGHFCNVKMMHKYADVRNYAETLTVKDKFHSKKVQPAFKSFQPLPDVKHCGSNSLSSFGLLQLINLGKYLFMSYFGKLKSLNALFLSRDFANTSGDKTLFQSLSALLFGLLNEKQFVYTEVNKLSVDNSKISTLNEMHQGLQYFVERSFVTETHLFKDAQIFTRNISGVSLGAAISSKDVISYLSNSLCSQIPGLDNILPLSYDNVNHIFNLSDSYNSYLSASSLFWSYSLSRTAPLRTVIRNWLSPVKVSSKLKAVDSNNNDDDLKIVTVDDLLMFSFLSALNVSVSKHLTPASRFIVESFVLQDSYLIPSSLRMIFTNNNNEMVPVKNLTNTEKSLPQNSLKNQFPLLRSIHAEQKMTLSRLPSKNNLNVETFGVRDLPLFSPKKVGALEAKGVRSENIESPNRGDSQTYIRILYNGQVITSLIPGCNSSKVNSLGLCSFEKLEHLLTRTTWQYNPGRDEL